MREKFDCQARFSGYQGIDLIPSTSLPSAAFYKHKENKLIAEIERKMKKAGL